MLRGTRRAVGKVFIFFSLLVFLVLEDEEDDFPFFDTSLSSFLNFPLFFFE